MTRYNNKRMGRMAKGALALLVLFGASHSYAECTQVDVKGTWYFNGVTGDTLFGDFWESDFCKIKVNSKGIIRNTGSVCKFRDVDGVGTFNVKDGRMNITSACAITGRIKYCGDGFCVNLKIDDAKLDKAKTVITLVGHLPIAPEVVSFFTGVKK